MKQLHPLDGIDRRIVAALQEEGDISHAVLAERVGTSSASCWRRIRALEGVGILTKTVRLVDAVKVGRGVNVLCSVRMRSHVTEQRQKFEHFIRDRGEVMECYSMSGDWDYLLRIVAEDVADYERFLMHVLLSHESVATASSHFALAQVKYTTKITL